jgi:pilus assembly protein CpaE
VLKIPANQLAKARARRRNAPANDNLDAPEAHLAGDHAPDFETACAFDEEEETEFVSEPRVVVDNTADEDEPPFDPPDLAEALGPSAADEEDIPFDAPDESDEIFRAPVAETPEPPPKAAFAPARIEPVRSTDEPLPPIRVHAFWDRPEAAEMIAKFASDRRAGSATFDFVRGGAEAAIERYGKEPSPDLLLLDTTLRGGDILSALDRLARVLLSDTQVIVLGGVNDVTLLRELSARGVAEYIVAPFQPDHLARAACVLFADADKSHTIAVIGARGGVGASTLAMNLAWSIAEHHAAATALVDLDFAFGGIAPASNHSIAEAFAESDAIDAALERSVVRTTPRLRLYPGPGTVAQLHEFDADALHAVIARVRRTSSFVVLDLPHVWNDWVKQTLLRADSVLVVTSPDLAGLRNTDNMLKLLRSESARVAAPAVVLSMTGVPKRPEILQKDFTEALMAEPAATIPFDPALFGDAVVKAQTLAEAQPESKTARTIDDLASLLSGRPRANPPKTNGPAPMIVPRAHEAVHSADKDKTVATEAAAPATTASCDAKPEEEAPLDLVCEAPRVLIEPQTPARKTAARQAALEEPRRPTGLLRAAIAVLALVLAANWYAKGQTQSASAAEPAPVAAAEPQPTRAEQFAAQYEQALLVIGSGEIDDGAMLLRRLGDRGYAPAQYRLAKMYERGEWLEADPAAALQWTERAAAGGHPRAMHDLGVYIARGDAAPADDAAAFRWFRQAADFNIADSQFNLGVLYQQGRGVTADAAEAMFWFLLAARQDDESAAQRAAALEAALTPMQAEQARARAEAFRPRPDPYARAGAMNAG